MAKNSKDAYGASGTTNLLTFDPANLKLITSEKHPLYDKRVEKPIDESMVLSIMEYGVKEPVIVWKDPETGDVCVVAGRQRVKNNIEANKRLKKRGEMPKDIKAIVERGDPKKLMAIMAIENEGRTANTPQERAELAERMLEAGYTEDALAIVFHCSKSTVKNYISLLETTGAVRKAVSSGRIDPTDGYKLSKLPPAEQNAKLEEILKANGDNHAIETEGGKKKKKRRKNAKKIREIISGSKEVRSKRSIQDFYRRVSDTDQLKEGARHAVVAVLDWVLGKEETPPSFTEAFWKK